jgi:hypothetical protein
MTKVLIEEGFWASYNVPSFPQIRKKLGYDELLSKYPGEAYEFGYESSSRGQYFKKHSAQISSLGQIKQFMQTPPVSPRDDRQLFGSIDTKITDSDMIRKN